MMLMTDETRKALNDVLTQAFLLNMICDNLVYEIDYEVYPQTASLVHENYAHYWPALADQISDLMLRLNARPFRGAISDEYKEHGGNLADIFAEIANATEMFRKHVLELIDVADLEGDAEVRIFAEEILTQITAYRKQADIWAVEAKRYEGNYRSFDARIRSFTTMIPVSDVGKD